NMSFAEGARTSLAILAACAVHPSVMVGGAPYAAPGQAVTPATAVTAVKFGRLWDGEGTIEDAVVVVENGRIAAVGRGDAAVPRGAEVIDQRACTGIPGLIDLHTHMTYYWDRAPGTQPLGQRRRPAVTVFLAQENARRTLATGVTTVRDLGASGETDLA